MSSDATLIVKHLPGSNPASFLLTRAGDVKSAPPVEIADPASFPVKGRPDSNLVRELCWYLETFLDYPFPPETDHADRVQEALRDWGQQAFLSLLASREALRLFDAASSDYQRLHL